MTTHTTFETSRLLAENGFPKPEFQFGQAWYTKDVFVRFCLYVGKGTKSPARCFVERQTGSKLLVFKIDDAIFAPTASDIFNWMKSICQEKKDPRIYHERKGIFMNALESDPENTAEAVALAAISFIGDK